MTIQGLSVASTALALFSRSCREGVFFDVIYMNISLIFTKKYQNSLQITEKVPVVKGTVL
jgi:hypothetical protein